MRGLRSSLGLCLTAALLVGCGDEPNRIVIRYPSPETLQVTAQIELLIGEDRTCSDLERGEASRQLNYSPHTEIVEIGAIRVGHVAFLARARDMGCVTFLEACTVVLISERGGNVINLDLKAVDDQGCGADQHCEDGRCMAGAATDASVADRATPDAAMGDTLVADSAAPDVNSTDAGAADAAIADAAITDIAVADTRVADNQLPDTTLPDSAVPDSAAPDASLPPPPTPALAFGFDEWHGVETWDVSGGDLHGQLEGSPTWQPGISRAALELDGVDDGVDIGYGSIAPVQSQMDYQSLSVAAWVWLESSPSWSVVYQIGGEVNGAALGFTDSGSPTLIVRKASTPVSAAAATPAISGAWVHLCGVKASDGITLYVDGQEAAHSPGAFTWNSGNAGHGIGRNNGGCSTLTGNSTCGSERERLAGRVDELRVYPGALSQEQCEQVKDATLPGPPPLLAYALDEGSGDTVGDSGRYGYPGTRVGATWSGGHSGEALAFAGGDHVEIGYQGGFFTLHEARQELTVSAWINVSSAAAGRYQPIYQLGGQGNAAVLGLTEFDHLRFLVRTNPDQLFVDSPAVIGMDSWVHVTGVKRHDGISLYIDGLEVAALDAPYLWETGDACNRVASTNGSESAMQGTTVAGGEYFEGMIDDLYVYSYARDDAERLADMTTPVP